MKGNKAKLQKPNTLAQTLAKKTFFFGVELMKRCSPGGTNDLPALPTAEMYALKKAVLSAFPRYWHSLPSFEHEWKYKCWPAIEQACGSLRHK